MLIGFAGETASDWLIRVCQISWKHARYASSASQALILPSLRADFHLRSMAFLLPWYGWRTQMSPSLQEFGGTGD